MSKLYGDFDKPLFFGVFIITAGFIITGIVSPENFSNILNFIFSLIGINFGWWFILIIPIFLGVLLWAALSKHGKLVIGNNGDKPEYSYFSWFAMLFSAGIGVGFIFWGVAEPMYHWMAPPPYASAGAGTQEQMLPAMGVSFLHWGILGWVPYCVVGLIVAFFSFRYNKPMTISTGLYGILGENTAKSKWSRLVDFISALASVCGVSTSLGMGILSLNFGISKLFNVEVTQNLSIIILISLIAGFVISTGRGIQKGMKRVSDLNLMLAFGVLIFFIVFGPTKFIGNMIIASLGTFVSELVPMATYTGITAAGESWLNSWTVFYWCWWIAWGPFVGGFVARISKGRTVREFILGVLLVPFCLTLVWFNALGGSAMYMEINGIAEVWQSIQGNSGSGIFVMLEQLPLSNVLIAIVIFNLFLFLITSADAASFLTAMLISKGNLDPTSMMRVTWGIIIGILSLILLLTGGLQALQTISMLVAAPFSIVMVAMIYSFVKNLLEIDKKECTIKMDGVETIKVIEP